MEIVQLWSGGSMDAIDRDLPFWVWERRRQYEREKKASNFFYAFAVAAVLVVTWLYVRPS
jgi:hypothetical protein